MVPYYAVYPPCGCSTSSTWTTTSTTSGCNTCPRCGYSDWPYIWNDTTVTITNTFDLRPPKNWRWFHIFSGWLVNRIEALREQVKLPLSLRRYQARSDAAQQRRHKRKRYLIDLRAG